MRCCYCLPHPASAEPAECFSIHSQDAPGPGPSPFPLAASGHIPGTGALTYLSCYMYMWVCGQPRLPCSSRRQITPFLAVFSARAGPGSHRLRRGSALQRTWHIVGVQQQTGGQVQAWGKRLLVGCTPRKPGHPGFKSKYICVLWSCANSSTLLTQPEHRLSLMTSLNRMHPLMSVPLLTAPCPPGRLCEVCPLPGTCSVGLGTEGGGLGVCCNQSQESMLEASVRLPSYTSREEGKPAACDNRDGPRGPSAK